MDEEAQRTMNSWLCNGARLAGEERGDGDPAILLVHGWCCDRSFLGPQADYFSLRHRVVSVDLRGHGDSQGAGMDCGIDASTADLVALIDALELDRPVVIGHSMGGTIALDLAVRHPERVRAIAMLDSLVARSPDLADAAVGLSYLLASPRCSDTIEEFVREFLLRPDTDLQLVERVIAKMRAADPEVALDFWNSLVEFDDRSALKACPVPILFTAAESTVSGLHELPGLNGGLELVCMSGVSHFHPIEAADATNAHIESFLERLP